MKFGIGMFSSKIRGCHTEARRAAHRVGSITIYSPSRLNEEEIAEMEKVMVSEGYMTAITARQWREMDKVWTVYDGSRFCGLVAVVRAGNNCFEIGPVYLDRSCRGKNVTGTILSLIEQAMESCFLFTMSHNPSFQRIMDKRDSAFWTEVKPSVPLLGVPLRDLPRSVIPYLCRSRVSYFGLKERLRKARKHILMTGEDRWWIHDPFKPRRSELEDLVSPPAYR